MTDYLSAGFEIKAVDQGQRTISGYASVFGNIDRASDIVDHKAFDRTLREKAPADILVTIGHKVDDLPVGVPVVIRADAKGLYTESRIFNTRQGDDLLQTAKELLAHGQTLGMSFIYNVRDYKLERTGEGKAVRRLTDLDLIEITYGARQASVNQSAQVVGVKQQQGGASMPYEIRKDGDQWCVFNKETGKKEGCSDSEDMAKRHMAAMYANADGKMAVDDLPDSAFLFIEADGRPDMEGKTVPRSLRHFPYRDGAGTIDPVELGAALAAIPSAVLPGLKADALAARARWLFEGGPDGPDWKLGPAPDFKPPASLLILAASYALQSLAGEVAESHKAMRLLGEDTKAGRRMQAAMRAKLKEIISAMMEIDSWAETIDSGDEGPAKMRRYRAELERLRL